MNHGIRISNSNITCSVSLELLPNLRLCQTDKWIYGYFCTNTSCDATDSRFGYLISPYILSCNIDKQTQNQRLETLIKFKENPMIDKDLKYSGLIDVLRKMYFNEGFLSLWKGLSPSILMAVPSTAIQFRMYTYLSMSPAFDSIKVVKSNLCFCLSILQDKNIWGYQITKSAVCGITAGVCAKVAVYPLDVLKKRMQIRGSEEMRRHFGTVVVYENIFDCVWKVTYYEGPISWFKGLKPSLIKSGAFSGLIFIFYEMFRETILTYKEKSLTKS
ncbi:Mitochondrial thiamine pyrophosphate carrier [Armadillidium nasatum]|uniref:Mitochondrial thiamine pyrophosphate carrier n=1 Tax=Armadillidium nasatum TaxID=96803 RepID=A0A5N5TD86_9CRUS|nr:Mitochondrial thiamine pyrophosphate carrier [Armadillidium nasatum]